MLDERRADAKVPPAMTVEPSWRQAAFFLLIAFSGLACRDKHPSEELVEQIVATGSRPVATIGGQKTTAVSKSASAARSFLPLDCDVAVLVDAKRLLNHPKFGKPLLLGLGAAPSGSPSKKQATFAAFLRDANVTLDQDLVEVAGCLRQAPAEASEGRFVFALSGRFPPGLPKLMMQHVPGAASYEMKKLAGLDAIYKEDRWLVQTVDGALLLGNSEALLKLALKPSEDYKAYKFPGGQDLVVVGGAKALEQVEPTDPAIATALAASRRAVIQVDLLNNSIGGELEMATPLAVPLLASELEKRRKQLIDEARTAPAQMKPVLEPSRILAESATITTDGKQVRIQIQLPEGLLEGLLSQLGGLEEGLGIRDAPVSSPAKPPSSGR